MLTAYLAGISAIGPLAYRSAPPSIAATLFCPKWTGALTVAWLMWEARRLELLVGTKKLAQRAALLFFSGVLSTRMVGVIPSPLALAVALNVWKSRVVPQVLEIRLGKYIQLYPMLFTILLASLVIYDWNDLVNVISGILLGIPIR